MVTDDCPTPSSIDDQLRETPYLVCDGEQASAEYLRLYTSGSETRQRAKKAASSIATQAGTRLAPYTRAVTSELVTESNRIEGYSTTEKEVRELAVAKEELLNMGVGEFIAFIREDERLADNLGLFRAYTIADEWARERNRPRQGEIRSLHKVVMPRLSTGGEYKPSPNRIGLSDHIPSDPWDVQHEMTDLSSWFRTGTTDPILDAAVVHAWLTHIHPFDDGNGRMARLLANMALIQSDYPPLLLRSSADRAPYLDALSESDQGNILPLYRLFTKALRRRVNELAKPGYVDKKIKLEMLNTSTKRFTSWSEACEILAKSLELRCKSADITVEPLGLPSYEDFEQLEELSEDGNTWYLAVRQRFDTRKRCLLWFGYQSTKMRDLLGKSNRSNPHWPSILLSKPAKNPTQTHKWDRMDSSDSPDLPDEIVIRPLVRRPILFRSGWETEDLDIPDAVTRLTNGLSRICIQS